MDKLNLNTTLSFSMELTKLAIQNGLITPDADSEKTAKNVISFYQTLVKNINNDEK